MNARRAGFFASILSVLCWSAPVMAQDVATSEALFQKGLADMEGGKFDSACPAFAESLRLDPRAGTLFTLAECYAKAGKTASAVARYDEYLIMFARMTPDQQAKQVGREKIAQQQRDLIKPTIPQLTVELEAGSPADTIVKRDETVLNSPSLGIALPVDPGEHTVSAQVPGGPITAQTFILRQGEKKEIVLKVVVTTTTTVSTTSNAGPDKSALAISSSTSGDAQRIAAFVLGGAGIAGLVVGAATGGVTLAKRSDIEASCDLDTRTCNSAKGVDDIESARATGLASTIGFAAGGALLATGIVVFFTAPSDDDEAEAAAARWHVGFRAGPRGGWLSLTAGF